MSSNDIIDIEPTGVSRVGSSIARQQAPADTTAGAPNGHNAQSADSASSPYTRYYQATVDKRHTSTKKPSRLAGLIQMLVGVLCVIIGIPLLILPGPGLLTICGGFALIVVGFRKLFGSSRAAQTESSNNVV